jgi:predicted AlkP superfamily phosphohydrolase/phosphomutase
MRTVVIGLDGCSWNVLDPLLATGELPNLAHLRDHGAYGTLESTVPFFTGPAWASFATGASPAQHGVYDFMMLREEGRLSVARQSDLRRRTYYQQLGREGKRSILINLPLDQDGCEGALIVNSWLTADESRRLVPAARRQRYEHLLQAYRTFPVDPANVDELCEIERARFDLARELLLGESWDHYFCLFSATDWLGHSGTGAFLAGDEDARSAFLRLYRQIDEYVGWFVANADDATTAVISDHGQCAETAVLRVNAVLREAGYITLADAPGGPTPFFTHRRPQSRKRIAVPQALSRYRSNPLVRSAAVLVKNLLHRGFGVEVARAALLVDRKASRAFCPTDASFAIYTRDCDADDIERIRERLLAVTLDDGRRALDDVWSVEELYGQPYVPGGPMLLFSPATGVRPSATIKDRIVDLPRGSGRGCHQRDGIMLFTGGSIRAGELPTASIVDIAPTLLWAMGEGVPHRADGRPLFEAFEGDFVDAHPLTEVESDPLDPPDGLHVQSEEVTRRLRALGYI